MTPDREHDDRDAPTGRAGEGWQPGPDPDAPPWEQGGPPKEQTGEGAGPSNDGAPQDGDPPDDGEGTDPGGAADPPHDDPSAGAGDQQAGGGPEHGHQLAHLPKGVPPPRPPRRTGVFIDPDDLRDHVGGLLRAILGGYEVDAFGNFTFTHEGARVFVTVGPTPIGPQVGVFSVTNLDVALSPQLATFLLTTNHTLGFGAFSYDPSTEAVWLRHTLHGTTLDGPELQTAVAAVATTAARVDDAIKERFGGRTFQEAPSDVQERMEPPEPSQEPPNAGGYL